MDVKQTYKVMFSNLKESDYLKELSVGEMIILS